MSRASTRSVVLRTGLYNSPVSNRPVTGSRRNGFASRYSCLVIVSRRYFLRRHNPVGVKCSSINITESLTAGHARPEDLCSLPLPDSRIACSQRRDPRIDERIRAARRARTRARILAMRVSHRIHWYATSSSSSAAVAASHRSVSLVLVKLRTAARRSTAPRKREDERQTDRRVVRHPPTEEADVE